MKLLLLIRTYWVWLGAGGLIDSGGPGRCRGRLRLAVAGPRVSLSVREVARQIIQEFGPHPLDGGLEPIRFLTLRRAAPEVHEIAEQLL